MFAGIDIPNFFLLHKITEISGGMGDRVVADGMVNEKLRDIRLVRDCIGI